LSSDDWIVQTVILALSCLGVAFFSSVETALHGVTKLRIGVAIEKAMTNAKELKLWEESPGRVMATIHLFRLVCCVAAGMSALRLVGDTLPDGVIVGLLAVVLLFGGHLLARAAAKRAALEWALATIRIVKVFSWSAALVVWPLLIVTGKLFGALNEGASMDSVFWTPEEVEKLAEDARAETLDEAGEDLYRSIIEFSDTVVGEIMVPRTEMVVLPAASGLQEVRLTAARSGHSRIPVHDDTIDDLLGLLYVKDLSAEQDISGEFDLRNKVRPTFYVPEVMKISELLREFQRRKTHMAIVVDEYGGTSGLVTLEDIIEEIVGEIQDEYDVEEKQYRVIGEGKIIADGRVRLWDLEEPLGVEFPEDGGYETLAGFITARAGYLPAPGAAVPWNGLLFTVKEANEKRIETVEIDAIRSDNSPSRPTL